jgi:hypothetical protein
MKRHFYIQSRKKTINIAKDIFNDLNNNRIKNISFTVNNKNSYKAIRHNDQITIVKINKKQNKLVGNGLRYKLRDWIDANALDWKIICTYPEAIDYITMHPERIVIESLAYNPDEKALLLLKQHEPKLNDLTLLDGNIIYESKYLKILNGLYVNGSNGAIEILNKIFIDNILNLNVGSIHHNHCLINLLLRITENMYSSDKKSSIQFLANCLKKYFSNLSQDAISTILYNITLFNRIFFFNQRDISPILKVLMGIGEIRDIFVSIRGSIVQNPFMVDYVSFNKHKTNIDIDMNKIENLISRFETKNEFIENLCMNPNDMVIILTRSIIFDVFEDNKTRFLNCLCKNQNQKVFSIIIDLLDRELISWDDLFNNNNFLQYNSYTYCLCTEYIYADISNAIIQYYVKNQILDNRDYNRFLEKFEKEYKKNSHNVYAPKKLLLELIFYKSLNNTKFLDMKVSEYDPLYIWFHAHDDILDKKIHDMVYMFENIFWKSMCIHPHKNSFKIMKEHSKYINYEYLFLNPNPLVIDYIESKRNTIQINYKKLSKNKNIFVLTSNQEPISYHTQLNDLIVKRDLSPSNIHNFMHEIDTIHNFADYNKYRFKIKDIDTKKNIDTRPNMKPEKASMDEIRKTPSSSSPYTSPYNILNNSPSINKQSPSLYNSPSIKNQSPSSINKQSPPSIKNQSPSSINKQSPSSIKNQSPSSINKQSPSSYSNSKNK